MRFSRLLLTAGLLAAIALPAAAQTVQINGAGATFPYPIYSKWFSEYNKLHPEVEINYQSIGSGGGIRQLTNQTVFFGATDGPMTAEQLQSARRAGPPPADGARRRRSGLQHPRRGRRAEVHREGPRGHLPRQGHQVERPGDRGAEPGRQAARDRHHGRAPLRRFREPRTSSWTTSRRSRPSGRRRSASRRRSTGRSASAARATRAWPGSSSRRPGAIGYVELIYALQNKIDYGSVQNMAGEFVKASLESVTAAAAAAAKADAGGLPRLDHQRAGRGRLSDLVLHLAALLREPEGQAGARRSWWTSCGGR